MIYSEENCAAAMAAANVACLAWRKKESALREGTRKLFTRMWRVVPGGAEEAYALPVYDSLAGAELKALGLPRPDGMRLLRLGPMKSLYSLSHKGAELWTMKILSLSPSLDAREALNVGEWMYLVSGFEIETSDDWRRVTAFKKRSDDWESETFCLSGGVYESCGKNPNAPAPKLVLNK